MRHMAACLRRQRSPWLRATVLWTLEEPGFRWNPRSSKPVGCAQRARWVRLPCPSAKKRRSRRCSARPLRHPQTILRTIRVRPQPCTPVYSLMRIQPQVAEDLLDHRPLEDGRDDLELRGAAVRAVLHVDVEHALEQPRPADAVRPGLDVLDFALGGGCGLGGRLCLRGRPLRHHQRTCSLAFGASTPWNRMRCSRGRGTSAANRCMNSSGLITRCVVPSRHGVLSLSSTCPAALTCMRSSESAGRVM